LGVFILELASFGIVPATPTQISSVLVLTLVSQDLLI